MQAEFVRIVGRTASGCSRAICAHRTDRVEARHSCDLLMRSVLRVASTLNQQLQRQRLRAASVESIPNVKIALLYRGMATNTLLTEGLSNNCWQQSQQTVQYPPLRENLHTDVIIVGAGLSGLTTAYRLVSEGQLGAALKLQQRACLKASQLCYTL